MQMVVRVLRSRVRAFGLILLVAFAFLAWVPAQGDGLREFSDLVLGSQAIRSQSPQGAALLLGNDASAIFRFVRDEIAFEAYAGVLRGGRGTLLARAGNSFDQAVLLKEMLDAAGYLTRLTRARLPRTSAEKLVGSNAPSVSVADLLEPVDLARLGIESSRWRDEWRRHNEIVSGVIDVAARGYREQPSTAEAEESKPDPVAAVRDYLWVQLAKGGEWIDLHPAFPAGDAPAIQPTGLIRYISSIPAELFHWVRLRLFADRIEGEGTTGLVLLERRVLSASAAGTGVTLSLQPVPEKDKVRLSPAVKIGELILSAEPLVVPKSGEGALVALRLEVTVISPGERPVIVTVPLAEASEQGKALAVCEMGSLVEIMVVSGAVDQRAPLEWAAGAVRWIARVGYIGQGETNARLETGGFPSANPVLLHWSSLLADAWIRALPDRRIHLVAPAVACIVYSPREDGERTVLQTEGGILALRTSAPEPGVAARLFEEVARLHEAQGEKTGVSLTGRKTEIGGLFVRWREGLYRQSGRAITVGEVMRAMADVEPGGFGVPLLLLAKRHILRPGVSPLLCVMSAGSNSPATRLEELLHKLK